MTTILGNERPNLLRKGNNFLGRVPIHWNQREK